MKIVTATLATSHVDRHRDRLTLSALEGMVQQIQDAYIPINIEHDPRQPPIGRIADASLEQRPDGAYAVEGTIEVFEPGDDAASDTDQRVMKLRIPQVPIQVEFDRSFDNPEDRHTVEEIGALLGSRPQFEAKKALEPLTVLAIAGLFAFGSIAKGFFSKLGGDIYETLKARLKALVARRRQAGSDCVLMFRAAVCRGDHTVLVEVFATNPTPETVEFLFGPALAELDRLLPSYYQPETGVKRIVFELTGGQLELRFGVNEKCRPLGFG